MPEVKKVEEIKHQPGQRLAGIFLKLRRNNGTSGSQSLITADPDSALQARHTFGKNCDATRTHTGLTPGKPTDAVLSDRHRSSARHSRSHFFWPTITSEPAGRS